MSEQTPEDLEPFVELDPPDPASAYEDTDDPQDDEDGAPGA